MTEANLMKRFEKLERDNRRLKRGGLALLAMLVALTTIYATRPVPDVIKAHDFDVVDGAGRLRIRMATGPQYKGATIDLFDASGARREELIVNDFGIASVSLLDSHGYGAISLVHVPHPLVHSPGDSENEFMMSRPKSGTGFLPFGIFLSVTRAGAPTLSLYDPQGFHMDLGSTETQTITTGETQQTCADSIVMFGNNKELT